MKLSGSKVYEGLDRVAVFDKLVEAKSLDILAEAVIRPERSKDDSWTLILRFGALEQPAAQAHPTPVPKTLPKMPGNSSPASTEPTRAAWLSYKEAEEYASLSQVTLWRLLKSGEIQATRVGRAVRISRASLDEYALRHPFILDQGEDRGDE